MKIWRKVVVAVFAMGVTGFMAWAEEGDRMGRDELPFPERPYAYLPQPFVNGYLKPGPFYAYPRHSPDFRGGYPPEYRGGYPPEFRGGYPPEYRGGYPPEYRGGMSVEWRGGRLERVRPEPPPTSREPDY